ncbi:MAG: hypothetical protein K2X93_06690 [Candidatus Obscuribacterales bacterium]|nr:hypothetical protein [Candidatus Obscuribacterales bacterium]
MSSSVLQQINTAMVTISSMSDIFNTDPTTPAVNASKYGEVGLLLGLKTSGGTGQARIEAYSCTDATKADGEEIDYLWRKATTTDNFGAFTKAAAGSSDRCLTTVGATLNDQYHVIVRSRQCKANKPFVYFKLVEVVNDPVVAGHCVLIYGKPSRSGATIPSGL